MSNIIEKSFLLGLGVLTLTREKIQKTVDELVSQGELEVSESRKLIEALVVKGEEERGELRKLIRQELDKAKSVAPVSRQEFETLKARVDALTAEEEEAEE
jgi:polyhydroxyalkanoate synthesis regulator phasin